MLPSQLFIAALLCSPALVQHSTAASFWRSTETETQEIQLSNQKDIQKQSFRNIRNTDESKPVHNYSITAFKQLKTWKDEECNGMHNCATVSPLWCNSTFQKKMYYTQEDHINSSNFCTINLKLVMNSFNATVAGLDLSLYKIPEDPNADVIYYVYIIYRKQSFMFDVAGSNILHSTCSGWQTFHIDPAKRNLKFSDTLVRNLSLIVATYAEGRQGSPTRLSCNEISSLFVLDNKAILPSQNEETDNEEPTSFNDGKDSATTDNAEDNEKKADYIQGEDEEKGSSFYSGDQTEADEKSKEEDLSISQSMNTEKEEQDYTVDVEVLVPILTAFVAGESHPILGNRFRSKRDNKDEVLEEHVNLSTTPEDDKLLTEKENDKKKEDKEIGIPITGRNVTFNVTCELKERMVNIPEYLKDDSILAPTNFNIRQCVPSMQQPCAQCTATYGRLDVLKQVYNPHLRQNATIIISAVENIVVTACTVDSTC